MGTVPYFTPATFAFLRQLAQHNTHAWFRAHKAEYEARVREPALRLIADLQAPLAQISPHLVAAPRKVGGSLFRVMRDTRRPHPEGPYKPWIGLRFYHQQKNEVHAPSFFVHLSPEGQGSFMGGGLWRPEPAVLKRIRAFLDANPRSWQAATFRPVLANYAEDTDRLTQMPRGYPADHPLAEDLRRRSFVWTRGVSPEQALSADLPDTLIGAFTEVAPIVDYLCAALDLPF
jgi:uncharacterized protein (TIGR02453 family)